ncbi:MAG: hypothetical protein QNI96_07380 [Woeseiaceae bacterium]|nr:hypothetical protein [Woeseiaceae bacterium]
MRILRGAVSEVAARWRPLLRALIVPALLITALNFGTQYLMQWQHESNGSFEGLQALGWAQFVVWFLLYALFAMSCHRIILLGEESLPNRFGIYWTMRETRFLGWVVLVAMIYMLLSAPFQIAATYLRLYITPDSFYWHFNAYIPVLLATYVDGRISMVLPATAVGERSSIVESWRMTRGNGLHIAGALLIAAIATDLVSIGINQVLKDLPQTGRLVSFMVNFPLVAVAVGIISVSYRELSKE